MEIRRDVFQAIADPTRREILGLVALETMTPIDDLLKEMQSKKTKSKK